MKQSRAFWDAYRTPKPSSSRPLLDSFAKVKGFMQTPPRPPNALFNAVLHQMLSSMLSFTLSSFQRQTTQLL
eukprot:4565647-Pleurochrysis_carterae.AAC.1